MRAEGFDACCSRRATSVRHNQRVCSVLLPVCVSAHSPGFRSCTESRPYPAYSALAELFIPHAKTGQVKFECGWTVVMSGLHLGECQR